MARDPLPGEPPWLPLMRQPATSQVLAVLARNMKPTTLDEIGKSGRPLAHAAVARAARQLVALGLIAVSAEYAGTLDEPSPSTVVELTRQGTGFMQAWVRLEEWVTAHIV